MDLGDSEPAQARTAACRPSSIAHLPSKSETEKQTPASFQRVIASNKVDSIGSA